MFKMTKISIFVTVVLAFFLIYGLAFANDNPKTVQKEKAVHDLNKIKTDASKQHNITQAKPLSENIPANLEFFKNHLHDGMTQDEMITLLGKNYREFLTDQSGEPSWIYDFPEDPSYQSKVPPYEVDEKGLLTHKMRYQLSIVWNGGKIKSYIVFYNHQGTIDELKGKFFSGPYMNE